MRKGYLQERGQMISRIYHLAYMSISKALYARIKHPQNEPSAIGSYIKSHKTRYGDSGRWLHALPVGELEMN